MFTKEHRRELIVGSLTFGSMLIGMWAIFSWLPTWIQSIVTTTDAQKERSLGMMFMGMGGLTGGFLSGWLVNLAGIRKSMLICFSVCALFSFLLFKTNTSFTGIVYAEIAILALFFQPARAYYLFTYRIYFQPKCAPQLQVFVLILEDYSRLRLFCL